MHPAIQTAEKNRVGNGINIKSTVKNEHATYGFTTWFIRKTQLEHYIGGVEGSN